jgi:hypothetical protein
MFKEKLLLFRVPIRIESLIVNFAIDFNKRVSLTKAVYKKSNASPAIIDLFGFHCLFSTPTLLIQVQYFDAPPCILIWCPPLPYINVGVV